MGEMATGNVPTTVTRDAFLSLADCVEMLLSQQAHHVAGSIDYHSEHVENVAAQHTHVEGLHGGERRKLPPQDDRTRLLARKLNLGVNNQGWHYTADAPERDGRSGGREAQRAEDVSAEDSAIGGRIDQKRSLHACAVMSHDLAVNHWPH